MGGWGMMKKTASHQRCDGRKAEGGTFPLLKIPFGGAKWRDRYFNIFLKSEWEAV